MLCKLLAYLNQRLDKVVHFCTGYMLATILPINLFLGLLLTVLIGWAKEYLYDAKHPSHTVDKYDMLATWAGGLLGFVALLIK